MKHLVVLIVVVCFACAGRPTEQSSAASPSETFDDFLSRFRADSAFQKQRVQFPFMLIAPATHEHPAGSMKIDSTRWIHLTFEYGEAQRTKAVEPYTQDMKIYADSAKIEMRGIGNGLDVDFNFYRKDGKWFLFSETDRSTLTPK